MANTYFQFKQFIVQQDKTAMKVCTDACLFGAWIADLLQTHKNPPKRVLDIGAGTGLLSLMVAQKTDALVTAIEIDHDAWEQARDNVAGSVWRDRIKAIHADVNSYAQTACIANDRFGLIISNPPFYENSLRSGHEKKNMAMHDSSLTTDALLEVSLSCMTEDGALAVMLPYDRMSVFLEKANSRGMFLTENMVVRQSPKHHYFRSLMYLEKSSEQQKIHTEELTIKEIHHSYSLPFIHYLQDYYLSL